MEHSKRVALANQLLAWAYQETGTFEEGRLAADLLYLIMAILRDGHVEYDPADPEDLEYIAFLQRDDVIWLAVRRYIKPIQPDE